MSVFHVAVLTLILTCCELGTQGAMIFASILCGFLFLDLTMYTLLGATPLTLLGNLSTWIVWNVKGESVSALPYKIVFLAYLLVMGRAFVVCADNSYVDVASCWTNNTGEFRTELITGITNSASLAVFRF